MKGKFIISLDYELMWGVRDKKSIKNYGSNIAKVPNIIDLLLELFLKYEINATFSIVGFLFARNKQDLLDVIPSDTPQYEDHNLNPYLKYINELENLSNDEYHFAYNSINKIRNYSNHEISTHTFSHYYCLEPGQDERSFESDIESAVKIASTINVDVKSIVFPRNQHNPRYDEILIKKGVRMYRGNEKTWFYKPKNGKNDTNIRRLFRLIDTYVNISGHHTFKPDKEGLLTNIPSSRFLRPYSKGLSLFELIRLRRIKRSMLYAAKRGEIFHLWWHPHNFSNNKKENFAFLIKILNYYNFLNRTYGFSSSTMINSSKK